jgi:hypothetical protein
VGPDGAALLVHFAAARARVAAARRKCGGGALARLRERRAVSFPFGVAPTCRGAW